MSASFVLNLDTSPPASPSLLIEDGVLGTGSTVVLVTIGTADFQAGANDVAEMKLWGDVNPTGDLLVQPLEDASSWQIFGLVRTVVLVSGTGLRTIYLRLRDDVHNESAAVSASVYLDTSYPVVSIVQGIDYPRISRVPGYDTRQFTWHSNLDFIQSEVRVVPTASSPHTSGLLIQGSGGGSAGIEYQTLLSGADLEANSPGDGPKVIKVFVESVAGVWSV